MTEKGQQFLDWAAEYIKDDAAWQEILDEAETAFRNFFAANKELLQYHLLKKIQRGSEEHGSPDNYTLQGIDKEIADEFIDIPGWLLVQKWHLKNS